MRRSPNPYLIEGRLGDVVSAIQVMALNENFLAQRDYWAERITGDKKNGEACEQILSAHKEFFRCYRGAGQSDEYSLVWRHSLPYLDKRNGQTITSQQYLQLRGQGVVGRRPLLPEEIKLLTDTAIALHAKAVEQSRDWRWWVGSALTVAGVLIAALVGAYFGKK